MLTRDWHSHFSTIGMHNKQTSIMVDEWLASEYRPAGTPVTVGEIATLIQGRAYDGKQMSYDRGLPVIKIGNVTGTQVNAEWYCGNEATTLVSEGDVLVANAGTIGVYRWSGTERILGRHLLLAGLVDKSVDVSYFFYAFRFVVEELKTRAVGQTIKRIAKEQILSSEIPLPSQREQKSVGQST